MPASPPPPPSRPFLSKFRPPRRRPLDPPLRHPGDLAPAGDEAAEIARNLRRLLRTRRGFGAFQRDLGVEETFGYHASGAGAEALVARITETIAAHEPRLRLEAVELLPGASPAYTGISLQGTHAETGAPLAFVADARWGDLLVRRAGDGAP